MNFPGDLTDEELQNAYQQLREIAEERWGLQRSESIEPSLQQASAAVARLSRIRFSRDDAPGFYLQQTSPDRSP